MRQGAARRNRLILCPAADSNEPMDRRQALALVPAGVRRWLPYWLLVAGVFVGGATIGAAVGAERSTAVVLPVRASGEPLPAVSALELFLHNVRVAATMVGGGLLAGIPTLYLVLFNGFVLGSVGADAAGTLGPLTTVALLVPHGILELPALWLAAAVPARWLHVVWNLAAGRDRTTPVPRVMARTAVALGLVVVLLGVAAVVEATVTLALARAL